jgi:hypothetical protein
MRYEVLCVYINSCRSLTFEGYNRCNLFKFSFLVSAICVGMYFPAEKLLD